MDTTETYIKMADNPDIQRFSPTPPFHMQITLRDEVWDDGNFWLCIYDANEIRKIWLPRQDQLQAMVDLDLLEDNPILIWKTLWNTSFKMEIKHLDRITRKQQYWYYIEGESMEQLWLAFVMKVKFSKAWDGETWQSPMSP